MIVCRDQDLNSSQLLIVVLSLLIAPVACHESARAQEKEPWFEKGKELYLDQCATCHGDHGEGVEGAYEDPLEGDLPVRMLSEYVDKTMPEDDPEMCVGEDSEFVTRYMIDEAVHGFRLAK